MPNNEKVALAFALQRNTGNRSTIVTIHDDGKKDNNGNMWF